MRKLFLSLLMLFTSLSIASCSSFVGDDETIIIKDVKQELGKNEKGEEGFYIIIEYDSDTKKPDKFFVPNGKKGDTGLIGNGIKDVTSSIDEVTKETTVTITFTDETMKPVEYKVPIGVAMKDVTTTTLEDGSTSCVINFTDGSKSEPILLPKGEKGDGFEKYECIDNEDGSKVLKFYFTNHDPVIIEIRKPNDGKDGNYIKTISAYTEGDRIYMDITFNDGDIKQVDFLRPNTWLRGPRAPIKEEGIIGDFYFDTAHKIIYEKNWSGDEIGEWKEVISLESKEIKNFDVTFDLNDTLTEPAELPTGQSLVMTCKEGTYFGVEDMELPTPVRPGYDFDGWYLTKTPTPNNGKFTDTTPVFSNLKLYAKWIKK